MRRSDNPTPNDVLRELSLILRSPTFLSSPLLQKLLKFVVEEFLQEGVDNPSATTIAQRALGKDSSFRSSKDSSVRVAISRLRKTLQIYYANEGAYDDVVISLKSGNHCPSVTWRTAVTPPSTTDHVLRLAEAYQSVLTSDANNRLLHALKDALKSRPDDAFLLAAYADACSDIYKYKFHSDHLDCPLDEAAWAINRAELIAPENPDILFGQGMFSLAIDDITKAKELGHKLLQAANGDHEHTVKAAWLLSHTKKPANAIKASGLKLLENSDTTEWLNHAWFLALYHSEDYEASLSAAINIGLPNFFWGPMLRAAALAQLGLLKAANCQLLRCVELNPNFTKAPAWHLHHHIKDQNTLEHVLEGLHKAGLGRC